MKVLFSTFLVSAVLLSGLSLQLDAQTDSRELRKDVLMNGFSKPGVAESFKVGGDWFPYPAYSDRDGWDRLVDPKMKKEIIKHGEKQLKYKFQHIPLSTYLCYYTTGEKQAGRKIDTANRQALLKLTLAELVEGQGRFLEKIIDGVWYYATSYSWSMSNQMHGALPQYEDERIALWNVRSGAMLSLVWHFFHEEFDKVDKTISKTTVNTLKRIIMDPYLKEENRLANWWLGYDPEKNLNNWTPWCNAEVMMTFLLVEQDQKRLDEAVAQAIWSVDRYVNHFKDDGACDEGPTYWGQSVPRLYEFLQIMKEASGGKFDVLPNDKIALMGSFVSRAFSGIDTETGKAVKFNYADASPAGSAPVMLMWKTGKAFGSKELTNAALYFSAKPTDEKFSVSVKPYYDEGYRMLDDVRAYKSIKHAVDSLNKEVQNSGFAGTWDDLRKDVPACSFYPQTEICFMNSDNGWFLGAKGGYNGEPHNHNDVGSFVLYVDNIRFFSDAGVGVYTSKTFGPERYTLWNMCADWHNIPEINGVKQVQGKEYKSGSFRLDEKSGRKELSVDLTPAYKDEAMVDSWVRTYSFDLLGKSGLVIRDKYSLKERKGADVQHFLVSGNVYLPGETCMGKVVDYGEVVIENRGVALKLTYPEDMMLSKDIQNNFCEKLTKYWGASLTRINFTSSPDAPAKGEYVMTITRF